MIISLPRVTTCTIRIGRSASKTPTLSLMRSDQPPKIWMERVEIGVSQTHLLSRSWSLSMVANGSNQGPSRLWWVHESMPLALHVITHVYFRKKETNTVYVRWYGLRGLNAFLERTKYLSLTLWNLSTYQSTSLPHRAISLPSSQLHGCQPNVSHLVFAIVICSMRLWAIYRTRF